MVSTQLKTISQIGNLPQIGMKIKNVWNHHPDTLHSPSKNWVLSNQHSARSVGGTSPQVHVQQHIPHGICFDRHLSHETKKTLLLSHVKYCLVFLGILNYNGLRNKPPHNWGGKKSSPIKYPKHPRLRPFFHCFTCCQVSNEFGTRIDESECKRKACLHRSPLTHLRS